jgi:hypothetical protein
MQHLAGEPSDFSAQHSGLRFECRLDALDQE